jgi:hypothetical protein
LQLEKLAGPAILVTLMPLVGSTSRFLLSINALSGMMSPAIDS